MKTMRILVLVEIRAEEDDDDQILEATKDALQEAMEDDTLDWKISETEDDDEFL